MAHGSLNPAMTARLAVLATRIASLKQTIGATVGIEQGEARVRLADMERRHQTLTNQVQALDGKGDSIWQSMKAEIELMADDLSSSVDDLTTGMALAHEPPHDAAGKRH